VKVLVVDDSKMMRMMHARSLRQAGYQAEVLEAGNGAEGLQVLDSAGPVDLIICDWNMPGMDGLEFVRAVRARQRQAGGPRVPILMVTSQGTQEQMARAKETGVDALLVKPVTAEALAVSLEMLLRS
jgi:two-component system chemotaxis response regulator CheY